MAYAQNSACSSLFYTMFHPACWNEELSVPTVGSTMPDGSNIPAVPVSGQAANQTVQAISNQQILDWQDSNINAMAELDRSNVGYGSDIDWKSLISPIIIGAGVIMGFKLIKGGR